MSNILLSFESFKNQPQEEYEPGCLMLYFNFSNWDEFVRNLVDEEDIYVEKREEPKEGEETEEAKWFKYGYEDEAHCTILYGFKPYENIESDIKKYLPEEIEDFDDIFRGDITIFENDGTDYDVVKFDVHSEKLTQLNKDLDKNFENNNTFPEYHPHMTIAYVKKGKGQKYIKEELKEVELTGYKFIYSDPEYNKTEL